MKIVFLNRYQGVYQRGAETFIKELSSRLMVNHTVDVLSGKEADSLGKILGAGYDVVIPVNGGFQSLKVSLGRFKGKYKMLITGHSGIGRDDILNILVRPDIFVALTDKAKIWAKTWSWGSRVIKIPNGIDLNKFSPNGAKINPGLPGPVILSVGALVWYKHHERVIRAVSQIQEGSVLIVGDGPEQENLEKLGKSLLGGRFKITKFIYEDMPKVYRSCDLFTLPSWDREAFGIVYLEAMASGLGVVAPDDQSRREIVGDGGLFVKTENIKKYSQALKQALKIDWSEKAGIQAKKFSWEKITLEYEKIMLSLL